MIDLPLKSETGFPLIVDWRNGQSPLLVPHPLRPGAVLTQHRLCDVDGDLGAEPTPRLVDHPVAAPARAIRGGSSDPADQFPGLVFGEVLPSRPFQCGAEAVLRAAPKPDVERPPHDAGGLGGNLDRQAITYVGKRQNAKPTAKPATQ